jgi:AcrR family transcriptional regulator
MATSTRPLDRRQRRSRAALRAGLLTVIAAKPYDAITIEDIAEAADVTRATFYAHYTDKSALLGEACQQLLDDAIPAISAVVPVDGSPFEGAGVAVLLGHARDHADVYRVILSGAGGSQVRALLVSALETAARGLFGRLVDGQGCTPPIPVAFTTGNFVAALIHTIELVLNAQIDGSPTEVAALFMRSQSGGLRWALGLDTA